MAPTPTRNDVYLKILQTGTNPRRRVGGAVKPPARAQAPRPLQEAIFPKRKRLNRAGRVFERIGKTLLAKSASVQAVRLASLILCHNAMLRGQAQARDRAWLGPACREDWPLLALRNVRTSGLWPSSRRQTLRVLPAWGPPTVQARPGISLAAVLKFWVDTVDRVDTASSATGSPVRSSTCMSRCQACQVRIRNFFLPAVGVRP